MLDKPFTPAAFSAMPPDPHLREIYPLPFNEYTV
jgi:hypothetical protein